jgi:hypothetical protein
MLTIRKKRKKRILKIKKIQKLIKNERKTNQEKVGKNKVRNVKKNDLF